MSTTDVIEAFEAKQHNYLETLSELVSIPSVSFPGFDQAHLQHCADKVAEALKNTGLENVELLSVENNQRPYVYADWMHAPGMPTLLLYAHYDVQPPGSEQRWKSPPFTLTEHEGRLHGRGSADDKGGLMVHIATIDSWLRSRGKLPLNVKILFEGEEEAGSPCLEKFLGEYREKLQSDIVIIPDVENFSTEVPGITVALRGVVVADVEIQALKQPLHSGLWGGMVPDPALALSRVINSLVDDNGDLAVQEILEMNDPLPVEQKQKLAALPYNETSVREDAGLVDGARFLGSSQDFRERIWHRPSVSINALQASSREKASSIICDSAWARISVRTVPNMDKDKVFASLKSHIEHHCPFGLQVNVTPDGLGDWWKTDLNNKALETMGQALRLGWDTDPVIMGCGGSIPFVQSLTDALGGIPALLVGVEDPQSRAHSENESLHLGVWQKSVKSCIHLYHMLASGIE